MRNETENDKTAVRPSIPLIYTFVLFCLVGGLLAVPVDLHAQDVFRLYAPPGSIAINLSYEWDSEEVLEVQVEHEGAAITDWFLCLDKGQAPNYTIRQANQGTDIAEYQVYKESAPYANIIQSPLDGSIAADNVVYSSDFGTFAAATEIISFDFYFAVASGQFIPSDSYSDTLTLSLYTGIPGSGSYTLEDSVSVAVTIRMAKLMDVYMDREPGIRSLDFANSGTDFLLATTHERSNHSVGYNVSITSKNYADDQTGHSAPYFLHETSTDYIEYSLTYGGVAVAGWISGSAQVTDSTSITDSGTTWLDKELRITYPAATDQSSGYYQDILTINITAK